MCRSPFGASARSDPRKATTEVAAIVRQAALPVVYRGVRSLPVHEAQILTYLKLSGLPVALLLNFNVPLMKEGIKRFVGHPAV